MRKCVPQFPMPKKGLAAGIMRGNNFFVKSQLGFLDRSGKLNETKAMQTKIFLRLGLLLILSSFTRAQAFGNQAGWIASGGFGLTVSPTKLLLSPQLEYVSKSNFFFGPLVQAGVGDPGVLFTGSVTGRFLIGHHPNVKPSVEGGLGLAAGSGFSDSVGVHIMFGMGMDYIIDNTIAVGTMIRANFAPPLKTFFLSWPIAIVRFAI